RIVRHRESGSPLLNKILDVGVVAVVETTLATKVLHQLAVESPVLAQIRVRKGERVKIVVASRDPQWKSKRDRRRFGRLLDDDHIQSPDGSRRGELRYGRAIGRKIRQPRLNAFRSLGIESPCQADAQSRAAVMPPVEALDIVKRDRLEPLRCTDV